jgi:LysR family hydrogen peroxide-inducible transcriptional activator
MAKAEQLSFKQIRYFQAIAEAGSFRRAADRIGVKQPTLTVQMAALEATFRHDIVRKKSQWRRINTGSARPIAARQTHRRRV